MIDLDIRAFFDSLDHDLILKAVAAHTRQRWFLLYLRRWLQAPLQRQDGTLVQRDRGTAQGSAISRSRQGPYRPQTFQVMTRKVVSMSGHTTEVGGRP